jgi:hypothetical protein
VSDFLHRLMRKSHQHPIPRAKRRRSALYWNATRLHSLLRPANKTHCYRTGYRTTARLERPKPTFGDNGLHRIPLRLSTMKFHHAQSTRARQSWSTPLRTASSDRAQPARARVCSIHSRTRPRKQHRCRCRPCPAGKRLRAERRRSPLTTMAAWMNSRRLRCGLAVHRPGGAGSRSE